MAAKKKASKEANSSKKSTKNTSRKAATVEQVVETVECVDLTMFTKKPEMRLGESRRGKLKKRGRFDYKFVENGTDVENLRPWECHVKLAEEKPYARISANSNGGFLYVYAPRENFNSTRELVELFLDQTERLCEKVDGMDVISIIDKLDALKRELLNAV